MRARVRQTVVIGGSKGIGRHLALLAARRGDSVVVCARDEVALQALVADAGAATPETMAGDFMSSGAPLDALVDRIAAHAGPTTVLLCAASLGPVGALVRVDIERWAEALQVNVVGSARIIARLVPHLGAEDLLILFSGGGVGGPRPQPRVSGYTTSKVALTHLAEVVASENPGGPVIVAVAPGAFPTSFTSPVLEAPATVAGEALLADVARTRALPFDASDLEGLLHYLEAAPRPALSGRTLSAAPRHSRLPREPPRLGPGPAQAQEGGWSGDRGCRLVTGEPDVRVAWAPSRHPGREG